MFTLNTLQILQTTCPAKVSVELLGKCNMPRWSCTHRCFSAPPLTEEISWTTKGAYAWRSRARYRIALTCTATYQGSQPQPFFLSGGLFFFNKMRPFLDERPHVGSSSEVLSPPSTVELKKCRQTQLKESESSAGEVLVIVTLFSWFLL